MVLPSNSRDLPSQSPPFKCKFSLPPLCSNFTDLYDLSLWVSVVSWPEKVRTRCDRATLVGLLEETRRGHGTVGPQCLMVLVAKAVQLLKGAHNERDGCQLSTGVCHFFFIQTERLKYQKEKKNYGDVGIMLFCGICLPGWWTHMWLSLIRPGQRPALPGGKDEERALVEPWSMHWWSEDKTERYVHTSSSNDHP